MSTSTKSSSFRLPGGNGTSDSIRSLRCIALYFISEGNVIAARFFFVPHLDTCWVCPLSRRCCSSSDSFSYQRAPAGSSKKAGLNRRVTSSAGSEEIRAWTWSTKPSRQASRERRERLVEVRGHSNIETRKKMKLNQVQFQSSYHLSRFEDPVILRVLRHGPTRRALIVGCGLQMFQQLSGINTVMYVHPST